MALAFADHIFSSLSELRFHPTDKRVRAIAGGRVVTDSLQATIVWEPRRIVPSYAVPLGEIEGSLRPSDVTAADARAVQIGDGPPVLDPGTPFTHHTTRGTSYDIELPSTTLTAAAFVADDPALEGVAVLDFDAFDEWREEDELLVGHARDPFTTIDTRRSSRRVVVERDGVVLADSTRSVMLFETYLPTRYYLPRDDVRMELLRRSDTSTVCAYKGAATYWSAELDGLTLDDLAWTYEEPHNFAVPVRDMVCFFNERVDLSVGGRRIERPRTPWS